MSVMDAALHKFSITAPIWKDPAGACYGNAASWSDCWSRRFFQLQPVMTSDILIQQKKKCATSRPYFWPQNFVLVHLAKALPTPQIRGRKQTGFRFRVLLDHLISNLIWSARPLCLKPSPFARLFLLSWQQASRRKCVVQVSSFKYPDDPFQQELDNAAQPPSDRDF